MRARVVWAALLCAALGSVHSAHGQAAVAPGGRVATGSTATNMVFAGTLQPLGYQFPGTNCNGSNDNTAAFNAAATAAGSSKTVYVGAGLSCVLSGTVYTSNGGSFAYGLNASVTGGGTLGVPDASVLEGNYSSVLGRYSTSDTNEGTASFQMTMASEAGTNSYEKSALYVDSYCQDASSYSGTTYTKDCVAGQFSGILDVAQGRAWGWDVISQSQAGLDGILVGGEVDTINNSSDSPTIGTTNSKYAITADAEGAYNSTSAFTVFNGGAKWHDGFACAGNSVTDYCLAETNGTNWVADLTPAGQLDATTLNLLSTGSSNIESQGTLALQLGTVANAVDQMQIEGGVAGSPGVVQMNAIGTDTNISIILAAKGSGGLQLGPSFAISGSVLFGGSLVVSSVTSSGQVTSNGVNVVNLSDTQTLTNKTLTSPVISGGTINNASVGATTTSTGAFTTLSASSDATIGGTTTNSASTNQTTIAAGMTPTTYTSTGGALFTNSTNGSVHMGYGTTCDTSLYDDAGSDAFCVLHGVTGVKAYGAATVAGTLTATGANNVMAGITSGNAPSAGIVGQDISATVASGSAVSLTTATIANITSVSLTAGDWNCNSMVGFVPGSTTSITDVAGAIYTSSAAFPTQGSLGYFNDPEAAVVPGSATNYILNPTGTFHENISSTTTVYLNAEASFSVSTLGAFGTLTCQRMN